MGLSQSLACPENLFRSYTRQTRAILGPTISQLQIQHELEYLRLQENLFRPGLEIGDTEFPQEGGLEEKSVDFDKGCYLGQEVMARIHAMGKVRKQAVAVRGTGKPELPCPLLDQGKPVGTLKSQFSSKFWR